MSSAARGGAGKSGTRPGIVKGAAKDPTIGGLLTHLKIPLDAKVPEVFFLPGDPSRVDLFGEQADPGSFERLGSNREFTAAQGSYQGRRFGVCSTGIGGGSTEIAVVELFRLGVKAMIRTGGCGALRADIECGSFILNSGAVRWGGSASCYAPPEFPAVADPELTMTLAGTCDRLGFPRHIGVGATADSYYEGQGRVASAARIAKIGADRMAFLKDARVLNLEMETETLYTIGYVLGARTANILVVHGNRETDDWLADYGPAQRDLVKVALESLSDLYAAIGE